MTTTHCHLSFPQSSKPRQTVIFVFHRVQGIFRVSKASPAGHVANQSAAALPKPVTYTFVPTLTLDWSQTAIDETSAQHVRSLNRIYRFGTV